GILAFQLNFIDRQALLAAFDLWTGDKGKAIGDIFVEMGELDPRYRELLDGLVAAHLEQHDGDAEKSVATSFGSLRDEARAALEGSSFGDAMAATVAVPQPENSSGASPGDKPQHDQSLAATVPYLQPSETDTATGPQRADRQAPKTRFGDYELVGEIARGGMGVVYKARQSKLNRVVALKMIKAGEFADANQVKRFHSEAEAAAKLDHPGIVPVHEVGEIGGQHFYSMAFVEGKSLNDRVKQDGPLAPRSAAQMIKSVAHAVHYAHSRGILHRDIKPQNILLDKDELTRVTDFGLAKHVEGTNELTLTGQVIGTPSYMPPEQANGAMSEIGPTSDVYSLGATLYFLLTGRPPFQTASTAETVRQVIEVEPVPLRRLNPAIPRDLETICLKCLRKEQVRRYPTAAALAADLGRWLEHKPIVARPFGQGERAWLWCKRRPAVAAMIGVTVVAILGSGIAVKLIRTAAAKRQAQTELAASRGQAKSAVEALLTAPAAAVPYTLANLQPLKEFCITLVRAKLDDPEADSNQQLHAAFALAHLGKARHDFLLDAIVTAPAGECGNLVAALAHVKERALQELARRALSAEDPETKARIAIIALQMGDPKPAQKALALGTDATDRTALIHGFAAWHGD
ncbi:MAG TPA: serine/threonine-protein kinase, partial [Pirellulales bacterium]|nr:serine/threonine-protein kinase [Pirellulales bacterium]